MNNMHKKTEHAPDVETDAAQAGLSDTGAELSPPLPLGPGAQMAAQREAYGWTIEQVATQLNLAPRQIHALESENFAALPGAASTRGFIRSYARLLKIEPQAMLEMTGATSTASLVEPATIRRVKPTPFFADSRMSPLGLKGSRSMQTRVLGGLLALLLAAGAAYLMGWLPQVTRLMGHTLPVANAPAPNAQPVVSPPGEGKQAEAGDSGVSVTPLASALPAAAPAATVAPANKDALVLNFRQDSWFEVRRGSGNETSNVVAARVAKAGTTESFDVAELSTITIGNVAGVDATLRGEPLDLKSAAKNNVARLPLK
jgi:cytoskeleton protein RodZ